MQGISMALSIIAGLVVGVAGAFGREYLSRSLHSEGDVGRLLGLPVLTSIGDYKA
jgi:capsular polysaccharide biosynthesis protein